jgi:hypothetical protein
MAVGVVLEFDGTLDQYDQVLGKMGLERGGPLPDGGLFHWVTPTDGGFRVTDVWESREKFDSFSEAQIGPLSQEAGLGPPEVTFHEVHNYLAGPGA